MKDCEGSAQRKIRFWIVARQVVHTSAHRPTKRKKRTILIQTPSFHPIPIRFPEPETVALSAFRARKTQTEQRVSLCGARKRPTVGTPGAQNSECLLSGTRKRWTVDTCGAKCADSAALFVVCNTQALFCRRLGRETRRQHSTFRYPEHGNAALRSAKNADITHSSISAARNRCTVDDLGRHKCPQCSTFRSLEY